MNRGLDISDPSLFSREKSSYADMTPFGVCMGGDSSDGAKVVGPLVGCSINCVGGPSTVGPPILSSGVDVDAPFLGLAGLRGG